MSVRTFGLILLTAAAIAGPFAGYMLYLQGIPLSGIFLVCIILFWLFLIAAGLDAFLTRGQWWQVLGLLLIVAAVLIAAVGLYQRSRTPNPLAASPELTPSFLGTLPASSGPEKARAAEAEEMRRSATYSVAASVGMLLVGILIFMNGIGLRAAAPEKKKKRRRKRLGALPQDNTGLP
jgi:hypothetical protein